MAPSALVVEPGGDVLVADEGAGAVLRVPVGREDALHQVRSGACVAEMRGVPTTRKEARWAVWRPIRGQP